MADFIAACGRALRPGAHTPTISRLFICNCLKQALNLKTPQSGTLLSLKHQVKVTKRSPLSPLHVKAKMKLIPSKGIECGSVSTFTLKVKVL